MFFLVDGNGPVFDLTGWNNLILPGARFWAQEDLTAWFRAGQNGVVDTTHPLRILGYPEFRAGRDALHLQGRGGDNVAGAYAELSGWDASTLVRFDCGDTGSEYVRSNEVHVMGSVANGNTVEFAGQSVRQKGNLVVAHGLQVKGVDRLLYVDHGERNVVKGRFEDLGNATVTPYEWTANAGPNNKVFDRDATTPAGTNNSGHASNEAQASWLV